MIRVFHFYHLYLLLILLMLMSIVTRSCPFNNHLSEKGDDLLNTHEQISLLTGQQQEMRSHRALRDSEVPLIETITPISRKATKAPNKSPKSLGKTSSPPTLQPSISATSSPSAGLPNPYCIKTNDKTPNPTVTSVCAVYPIVRQAFYDALRKVNSSKGVFGISDLLGQATRLAFHDAAEV